MAKTRGTGLLMVWADIDPGHEAEYHRWYDEEHIARLLAVPGLLSAGRYVALKGGPKNLALYELDLDNPASVLQELGRRGQAGEMRMTDAIDLTSAQITFFKEPG